MTNPLVSVLVPNYNNGKYLKQCLDSILEQTYKPIEVVFTDDCSTDDSVKIAEGYGAAVRVCRNPRNLGMAKNHNRAFELSTGKFIVFCASDDYLLPHHVEKCVKMLSSGEKISMVIGERKELIGGAEVASAAPFYNTSCIIPGERQAKVFMMSSVGIPCQVMLRRDVVAEAGVMDERLIVIEDLLWFKCALMGDVGYIQEPIAVYRTHNENSTANITLSMDFPIEYYLSRAKIVKIAKKHPYLSRFCDESIRNIARHILRYAQRILEAGDYEMVGRYLAFAEAFDPDVRTNQTYKVLRFCIESTPADPKRLFNKLKETLAFKLFREHSYEPPEGYRVYVEQQDGV